MELIKITYYRNSDKENLKSAIVKEIQLEDIKRNLHHIHIVTIEVAPPDSEKDYLLM